MRHRREQPRQPDQPCGSSRQGLDWRLQAEEAATAAAEEPVPILPDFRQPVQLQLPGARLAHSVPSEEQNKLTVLFNI